MRHRPGLVIVLLLVVLAGCLTGPGGSLGTDSPSTATPSPTPTPLSTPCPQEPESTDVSVPAWPELPDAFTNETALEYAVQFERAYVTRDTLQFNSLDFTTVYLNVDTEGDDTNVTRTDEGWLVHFWVTGPYAEWRTTPGTTEAPDHWDPESYVASYRLTGARVVRETATEPVDPTANGTIIQCPPDDTPAMRG